MVFIKDSIKEKRPNATAKGLFLGLFSITLQLVQTDRGSCGRCGSEDEEWPHWCDQGSRETRTSKDSSDD